METNTVKHPKAETLLTRILSKIISAITAIFNGIAYVLGSVNITKFSLVNTFDRDFDGFMIDPSPSDPTKVSIDNAISLALFSKLAYEHSKVVKKILLQWGFEENKIKHVRVGGTQAYVASDDTKIIVAFRGTKPFSVMDYMTDVKVNRRVTPTGKIHHGFMDALDLEEVNTRTSPWEAVERTIMQFMDADAAAATTTSSNSNSEKVIAFPQQVGTPLLASLDNNGGGGGGVVVKTVDSGGNTVVRSVVPPHGSTSSTTTTTTSTSTSSSTASVSGGPAIRTPPHPTSSELHLTLECSGHECSSNPTTCAQDGHQHHHHQHHQRQQHHHLRSVPVGTPGAPSSSPSLPLKRKAIFFTGHSLGGALAICAAQKMVEANKQDLITGIYTFGSPMVGDKAFADSFNKAMGKRVFTFINNHDIVARLPLSQNIWASITRLSFLWHWINVPYDYHHAGQEIFIDSQGHLRQVIDEGQQSYLRGSLRRYLSKSVINFGAIFRLKKEPFLRRLFRFVLPAFLNDHFPGDYVRALKNFKLKHKPKE